MAVRTALTEMLQLSSPIIQAPMAGGGDTVELVAAVSNAGGLGSIGAAYLTPAQLTERAAAVRARTTRPFAINLFSPTPAPAAGAEQVESAAQYISAYYRELGLREPQLSGLTAISFDEQLEACLATDAVLFSFTFGCLAPSAIERARRRGKLVAGTATTAREADALVAAGVDAIIAQGSEAGGHRGTFNGDFESGMIGTMALTPQIVNLVRIPVIASGGIMDGRGIAAALVLGAAGVQMGTAFLTCPEAGVSEAYKNAIFAATEDQTRITLAFSGRPARGIVNRMLSDYAKSPEKILPFPLQNALTRPLRTQASKAGRPEFLSLWSGQALRMARRLPAAELVAQLESELDSAIDTLAGMRSEVNQQGTAATD
jgi:nitronate monooxygenase